MRPPAPQHREDLLGPAALGLLTSAEQQELNQHLPGCARCRRELEGLTAVAGRLSALELEDTTTLLHASLSAGAEGALAAVARANAGERRRSRSIQAVLSAAASVAVFIAGLLAAGAVPGGASSAPLEAVAVTAPDGVRASADLVTHTWGVEIKLEVTGLNEGRPYTVEVTTATGQVTGAGAFLGTGEQALTCNLNTSVLRPDAQSFTVLDDTGAPVITARL